MIIIWVKKQEYQIHDFTPEMKHTKAVALFDANPKRNYLSSNNEGKTFHNKN